MALQECGLNLNRASNELQPHGSIEFPCAGYASRHTARPDDVIPWHWHEELELVLITEGQMNLKTPSVSLLLQKGDVAAINSNTLHYAAAAPECSLHALVFSPALITGGSDSAFAKKYIRPLLSCRSFSVCRMGPDAGEPVSDWFCRAFDALANDRRGFEFVVREQLSHICFHLYETFAAQMETGNAAWDRNSMRIRKMLDFLQERYADRISLKEISGAADLSERECLRCFQTMLQISPVQYLLKYRVMRAAEMLLADPASSISEIAVSCGFDSPSNFTKRFRRFYACTPREYRHLHAE